MVVKVYKVDLDYEASLFDPDYVENSLASLRVIREFEYVYFLLEKEKTILKNMKEYDSSYLDHLKNLGFIIPEFNPHATTYEYWWGYHHNKIIEKNLNSKVTSAQIAQKNHWGFSIGAIVKNLEELKNHLDKNPSIEMWMLKHPYSFSGIGHSQFRANSLNIAPLNSPMLLEPLFERVFDIGTTFEIKNGIISRQFMVENFNSSAGAFKGGAGSSSVEKFKKYIFKKYSYSLNELEEITQKIAATYMSLGAVSNIQIDSFVYKSNEGLKLYALVEVNYRKTMGLVIQSLAEKYPEADWVEWRVESKKKLKDNPLTDQWIKLSPPENHFQSFFKAMYFS